VKSVVASWRLAPEAGEDLLEIGRYTAQEWGEAQSERYLDSLSEAFDRLAVTPRMGRSRNEIRPDLLSLVRGSHVIWYRQVPAGIEILRVLHARQSSQDAFA
jgi:toxin ParE1/3/4